MTTHPQPSHPGAPTTAEIGQLVARLRDMSERGAGVDPAERAALLAEKHALIGRITAGMPERLPTSGIDPRAALHRLTQPARPDDPAELRRRIAELRERLAVRDTDQLRAAGYQVQRFAPGRNGWVLLDADGATLMVGEHGCVAPTRWEAVQEGLSRVRADADAARALTERLRNEPSPAEPSRDEPSRDVEIPPGVCVPFADGEDEYSYRNYTVDEAVAALAPSMGELPARAAVAEHLSERYPQMGPSPYGGVFEDDDLIAIAGRRDGSGATEPVPDRADPNGDRGAVAAERTAGDPGPEVIGLVCPECGEDAAEQPPNALVPHEAVGIERPVYSHPDGEPLCPIIGPRGYQPADPVEVHAYRGDRPVGADRPVGRDQPAADGTAGDVALSSTGRAVQQAHAAVAAIPDPALDRATGGTDTALDGGEGARRAQLAEWHADDAGHGRSHLDAPAAASEDARDRGTETG